MNHSLSDPVVIAFIAIPVGLAVALIWATVIAWRNGDSQRATMSAALLAGVAALAWMAASWMVAESGVLRRWEWTPPPFAVLVVVIGTLAVAIAFSGFGRRLARRVPLWALVGVQGFRLPLELAMHEMAERGVMPEQ